MKSSASQAVIRIALFCALLFTTIPATSIELADTLEFDGHYYYLWPEAGLTWAQAQAVAAQQRLELPDGRILPGHLVTISSQPEQDFISTTYMTRNWLKLWIGGFQYSFDIEPAGYWAWVTGEEMGDIHSQWSYTFLQPPEPGNNPNNPVGNEDVLRMLINWGSGTPPGTGNDLWHDFNHDENAGDSYGISVVEFDELGDNFLCFTRPPGVRVVSSSHWRSSATPEEGWTLSGFDDSAWSPVRAPFPNPKPPTELIPGTTAQHMWHDPAGDSNGISGDETVYLRYTFNYNPAPDDPPAKAIAKIVGDDDYEFFVNGVSAHINSDGGNADKVDRVDFSNLIMLGENVLAIKATNYAKTRCYWRWNSNLKRWRRECSLIPTYKRVLFDAYTAAGFTEGTPRADLNDDCCVDRHDFKLLRSALRNQTEPANRYDLNRDGAFNVADFRFLVHQFTKKRGKACK